MSIIGNPLIVGGGSGGGSGYFTVTDTTDTAGGTIRTITPISGTPVIQASKSVSITSNGTTTIQPDSGNTAMAAVEVVTNVSGGGTTEAPDNDVIFIDYDGKIVYSYSAAEFANLSALPANPSHDGLTAQGWNWTLSDAKDYVATYGGQIIGQNYITTDGKTRIYIHLAKGRTSPRFGCHVFANSSVTIDWGDESPTTTLVGSGTTIFSDPHDYPDEDADYVITLTVTGGGNGIRFIGGNTGNTSSYILCHSDSGSNLNYYYHNCIRKIEIGSKVLVGDYAFYYCRGLKYITVPLTLTGFEWQYIFEYCTSLEAFVFPSGTTVGVNNYYFVSTSTLKYVSLPKTITSVRGYFLQNCYFLTKLFLPPTAASIGSYAMNSLQSLTELHIPQSVTGIANSGLSSLYALSKIWFHSTTAPTVGSSNAFSNLPTDCLILFPAESIDAYRNGSNYPSDSTYTYIGFATYANGATLPEYDTATGEWIYTWYATVEDALAQINPITVGNGNEVYSRA